MAELTPQAVKRGKTKKMYFCGTPPNKCCGSLARLSHGMKMGSKVHVTAEDAWRCTAAHLVSEGYIPRRNNVFEDPKTGYLRMLGKKSKFGARLRGGKEGRHMSSGHTHGTMISC